MNDEFQKWLRENAMSVNFMLSGLASQHGVSYNVKGNTVTFTKAGTTPLGKWLHLRSFEFPSWKEVAIKKEDENVRSTKEASKPVRKSGGPTSSVEE